MSSVLTVNSKAVSFVKPDLDHLEVLDYVALGVSASLLIGYHIYHHHLTKTRLHMTLSSHIEFSRMSWTKQIYYDYKNRVTTVQTFRSALGIIRFYFSVITAAILALAMPAMATHWWTGADGHMSLSAIRTIVPFSLLMVASANFFLTLHGTYYLHFHTQVEDLVDDEREAFGLTNLVEPTPRNDNGAGRDDEQQHAREPIEPEHVEAGETRSASGSEMEAQSASLITEQTKACSAVLAMQCNDHFRVGWRSLAIGLLYMTWNVSPIALLVGSVLVTWNFYLNDFPFSQMLWSNLTEADEDAELLHAKRAEISNVFDSLPS